MGETRVASRETRGLVKLIDKMSLRVGALQVEGPIA